MPAEVLVAEAALHYTAYIQDVPSDASVEVVLKGPGAPAAPVFSGTGLSDGRLGDVRLDPGMSYPIQVGVTELGGEAIPLDGLGSGAYTLSVRVAGTELARQAFELLEVPTLRGENELQVGPQDRSLALYAQPTGVTLWRTQTVADDRRGVLVFWFRDGEFIADQKVFAAPIGIDAAHKNLDDRQLVATQPFIFRSRLSNGSWELVFADDEGILGATRANAPLGAFEGLEPQFGKKVGGLRWTEPSAEARAYVEKALANASAVSSGPWSEADYCAIASDDAAREAARKRIEMSKVSTVDFNDLESRARSADAKVSAEAKETLAKLRKKGSADVQQVLEARASLQDKAGSFGPGCVAELIPEPIAAALDARP